MGQHFNVEGNLYFAARDPDRIVSLSPGGVQRWSYPLDPSTSSVLLKLRGDGNIIVGTKSRLNAYEDRAVLLSPSGQHIWTKPVSFSTPTIGLSPSDWMIGEAVGLWTVLQVHQPDGTRHGQYRVSDISRDMVFGPEGQLYRVTGMFIQHFDYLAGKGIWSFSFADDNAGRPAIGRDGTIYVALRRKLFAVNPDGSERWQVALPVEFACREIVIDRNDNLYCPALSSRIIHSFTPDGALRWQVASRNSYISDITVGSDGMAYVLGSRGIDAVSPDGKVRPVTSFPGNFLILGNGAFYPTFRTPFTPAGNIARPPEGAPRSRDGEPG